MKKLILIAVLLMFSGCGTGLRPPFYFGEKPSTKEELLDKTKEGAGRGLSTVWALSESNKLIFILILFAVVAGGVGAVTHLRAPWVICAINVVAAVGVVLLTVLAEALTRYLWLIGLVVIAVTVVGMAYFGLKFYITAKEAFGYAENLKKKVNGDALKEVDEVAKNTQPKFVRDVIKWFRKN
jgi:hypothetical protein